MKKFVNSRISVLFGTFIVTICMFFVQTAKAQVWIPVTASDAISCKRYSQNIKNQAYHSSATWKVTVKDNVISRTKALFSETFYNRNGQPYKIIYFGEGNRPQTFTIVKYNAQDLPFEEVFFSTDSVMLGGVLYEYDSDNLLSNHIVYQADSVTANYNIKHFSDSIVVTQTNRAGQIISNGLISTTVNDQKELVFRRNNEQVVQKRDYDILNEFTKKHIVGNAAEKIFIYENDQVVKTSVLNNEHEEISSASFEYDRFGNISRIIERRDLDGATNVYMINYR